MGKYKTRELPTLFRPDKQSAGRSSVVLELLKLTNGVHLTNDFAALGNKKRQALVASIHRISRLMRSLYATSTATDGATLWAAGQMHRAADNFLSLATWIYFPQRETKQNLENRLCEYLKIMLSGRFHELPRDEVTETPLVFAEDRVKGLKKAGLFLFLGLYMAAPVLLLTIVLTVFRLELHPSFNQD